MASKKKGKKQRTVVRHVPVEDREAKELKKETPPEPGKAKASERIREKDAGFGVLKIVGATIAILIVGSVVLFNRAGGNQAVRGDKMVGEQCSETLECKSGTICYSYKGKRRRCMTTCYGGKKCDPGYTCVSATTQKRRKGFRVTDVCVEDADI